MSKELALDEKGNVKAKNQEVSEAQKSQNDPAGARPGNLDVSAITHLQQTVGNSAVQTLLTQRKSHAKGGALDEDTTRQIQSKQGQGKKLERKMASKAGRVMNQDFSEVNVHTDPEADQLNEQLGAKAFTTGRDIFFRQGEYNPNSDPGQKLISHELTHVAQQGGGQSQGSVQTKMSVNDPNDQYESEADQVAQKVTTAQPIAMRDHAEEEEQVQTQEDEEEQVQMKEDEEEQVQMQEDEEEQVQMQEDEEEQVQMQEDEEEGLQRQEMPEEEEAMKQ